MINNFFKYFINTIDKLKSNFFYDKHHSYVDRTDSLLSDNCKHNNLNSNKDNDFHDLDPFTEVGILVNLKPNVRGIELSYYLEELKNISDSLIRIVFEDSTGKRSEILCNNISYVSVNVFVTLANRSGPIDSEQWSKVVSISRKIANSFNAMITVPDKQIVINKAKKLDRLCASLDAQIKFRILANHYFSKDELTEIICGFGFDKFNDGYILKSDSLKVYLSDESVHLNNKNNMCSLSIVMDIPCSVQDENILNVFFDLSNSIARKLDAKLVDSNGFILNNDSKELINSQLNILFKKLDDSGFTSGSNRSRRVFK